MELAELIIEKAQMLEDKEKSLNYLEIKVGMDLNGFETVTSRSFTKSIYITPMHEYPYQLELKYENIKWLYVKKAEGFRKTLTCIIKQIIRAIMKEFQYVTLEQQCLIFQVFYKEKEVFNDSYMISDDIQLMDLNNIFEDSDDMHDDIRNILEIWNNFLDMCLEIEFIDYSN